MKTKRGRYAIPINSEETRIKPPMITIRIPIDQYNQVVLFSRATKQSLNTICLDALQEYINKQPRTDS